jgi:YVTN family beta-propeller protein
MVSLSPPKQTASLSVPRGAGSLAYSPDGKNLYVAGPVVTVLDPATGQTRRTLPLTLTPRALFSAPDNTTLWVAGGSNVQALSADDGSILAVVSVSAPIWSGSLTPDGKRLYLALQNGHVAIVNAVSRQLLADVATPSPLAEGVVVPAGTGTIWLSGYLSQTQTGVIVLNASDYSVRATIPIGGNVGALLIRGSKAYVPSDIAGGSVTVIDTATLATVAIVSIGVSPWTMALRTNGGLYVTGGSAVYILNPATNTVAGSFPTQSTITQLAISPDGSQAAGALIAYAVSVVDVAGQVTGSIPVVGGVATVALSPDGSKGFAVGGSDIGLTIFDPATKQFLASVILPYPGNSLAVAPDGSKVYAGTSGAFLASGTLTIVDPAAALVVKNIGLPGFNGTAIPTAIAVTPDASKAYVSVFVIPFETPPFLNAYTLIVNTATNSIAGIIPNVGGGGLAVTPDGRFLYVATSSRIAIVNTASNKVVGAINNQRNLGTLALSKDARWLYAADPPNQQVVVIRTATNTVAGTIPIANGPTGLAFTPDGTEVWVTRSDVSLPIIDTATRAVTGTVSLGNYSTGVAFSH